MNIFQLSLFWVFCFASNLSVLHGGDPCKLDNYKDLNQQDRSETYRDATDKCDGNDLDNEWDYWYVVSGNAGNALATINAPAEGSCGTIDRLYLKDHHPILGEGIVTLKLCIAKGQHQCKQEQSIQVINCGAFYLYKLYDYGKCSTPWRYCTNGLEKVSCKDVSCPSSQTCALRKNGEDRHCRDPNQVPEMTTVPPVTDTSTKTEKLAKNAKKASPTSETTTAQPTTDTATEKPTLDTTVMALKSAESLPTPSSKSSVIKTISTEPDTASKTLPTATIKLRSSEATWSKVLLEREITEQTASTLKTTTIKSKIKNITTAKGEKAATEISTPTALFQTTSVNLKLSTTERTAQPEPKKSLSATTQKGRATELTVVAGISMITLDAPAVVTSPPLPSLTAVLQARRSLEATLSESSSAAETSEQTAIVAMSTKSNLKPPLISTLRALPSLSTLETEQSLIMKAALTQPASKQPGISASSSFISKTMLETGESILAAPSEILSTLEQAAKTATFTQSISEPSTVATSPSFPPTTTLETRESRKASSENLKQAATSATSTKSTLEPPVIETSVSLPTKTTLNIGEATEATWSESLATLEVAAATAMSTKPTILPIVFETSPPFPSKTMLQTGESTEATSLENLTTLESLAITEMSTKSALEPTEIAMTPTFSSMKTLKTGESLRAEEPAEMSKISMEEVLIRASSLPFIKTMLQKPESSVATYLESSTASGTRTRTRTRTRTGVTIGTMTTTTTTLSLPPATSVSKLLVDSPALSVEAVTETDAVIATSSKAIIGSVNIKTSLPLAFSITAASTAIASAQATPTLSTPTITTTTGTAKGQEAVLEISTNTESKLTPPTRSATSREATEEMNTVLETLFKKENIKTSKMLTLPYGKGGKTLTPPLRIDGSTSSEVAITITKPTAATITTTTAEGMATVTSAAGQPDDPCLPNPCDNYGSCSTTVEPHGFNCSCTSEYTGAVCENKIVHGNWSVWTQWPNCDKPCNGGNKTRKRRCDNPKPAFGGRYCIGPATETQFCNMDSCPADEVNYKVRFKAETWSDELENPESELYKNYKDKIQETVMALYLENGETVTFKLLSLRKGSIIASFNVTYPAIDSLQVVVLQEQIAGGTLGSFSAELLNISCNYVPNEAPIILESHSSNSSTIELKWSEVTQLNSAPLLGYVILYKKRNAKFQHDIQKSVLPSPRETVLEDLKKFRHYTIRVYAFTRNGNGIPSEALTLRTQEDVPSESPPNTAITVTSSRTIRVSWQPINGVYVHGILLGYEVRYAKDDGSTLIWMSSRPGAEIHQILLDELASYTWYWVVICARTSKGCGKEYSDLVQTWEDAPSMPPMHLTAYNFTSEASITVSWSPVPSNHINGILLGYSLIYERVQTSERQVLNVDEHTLTLRPTDLSVSLQVQAYSIYRIGVAAFTRKGMGPYTDYAYAESCRCPKVLYTNFWSTSPYLKVNIEDNKMEGIFSRIVTKMIFAACGFCPGHGSATIINITTNGKGEYSAKRSISEVLGDIDEIPQISFPIYGNKDITRYLGAYAYINLVETPGVAFVATKRLPGSMARNMINAVLECVPMIMLSACMAYISGFIMWVLDSRFNPDEFPPAFIQGVGEGFWWSFISMTTVGYGDRSPRSIPARIFGIVWILTGLIVISILCGAIASSLTFATMDKPVTLYGAKIGAIHNSVEYRLGILKNAKVNKEKEYYSVDEIRIALEDGEIDGALLDTYVAAEHKETLFNDRVYVKEILDRPIGYGVVLSGAAVSVEQRCRDYINMHITEIFHIIQNMTKTLDAPAYNSAMEQSTGLFDSTSEMFRIAMASLLAVLGVALLGGLSYHFLIFVPRRKRISEAGTTKLQYSYLKAFNGEMKAFVDSFCANMSKKISSIKKELQQGILNQKARPKCTAPVGRSADGSKRDTESSIVGSCSALLSRTSETQYEKHKRIVQIVSNVGNIQVEQGSLQDLQKLFPSSSGVHSKYQENFCSQTLPNMVISNDDVKNGHSSC